MTTQTYCQREDLEAIWSPAAVLRAASDSGNSELGHEEEAIIAHTIARAANKMNASLEMRYPLADLANNSWCRDCNAMLAVYLLATRRGNLAPDQIQEQYEQFLSDLEEIRRGWMKVPQVGDRHPDAPHVATLDTDLTHSPPRIVRR